MNYSTLIIRIAKIKKLSGLYGSFYKTGKERAVPKKNGSFENSGDNHTLLSLRCKRSMGTAFIHICWVFFSHFEKEKRSYDGNKDTKYRI
jgi:hypothetical protein